MSNYFRSSTNIKRQTKKVADQLHKKFMANLTICFIGIGCFEANSINNMFYRNWML